MEMRPGPATPTAFVRGFLLSLVTAWRRNDRLDPTAPPKERRICQSRLPVCHLAITNLQSLRWPAVRPGSEELGGGGGRNARATSRACARF
jgi:hypothetical protein